MVRIKVEGDRTRIDVEPTVPVATSAPSPDLTEESFFARLPTEHRAFAKCLRTLRDKHSSVSFRFGKAALIFENLGKNLLELYTDGRIKFREWTFEQSLGQKLGSHYKRELTMLYPRPLQSYTTNDKSDPQKTEPMIALLEEIIGRATPALD